MVQTWSGSQEYTNAITELQPGITKEKQLAFCAVSRHKFIAIYFLTSTSKRFRPETVAFPATSAGYFLLNRAEKKKKHTHTTPKRIWKSKFPTGR